MTGLMVMEQLNGKSENLCFVEITLKAISTHCLRGSDKKRFQCRLDSSGCLVHMRPVQGHS